MMHKPHMLLLLPLLLLAGCLGRSSGTVPVVLTTMLLPTKPPHPVQGAAQGTVAGYHGSAVHQHLKLLNLLTIGIHLKVDAIIIPYAASRVVKAKGRAEWIPQHPETLWDISSIRGLLSKHNVGFIRAQSELPPPGSLSLPNYYFQALDMAVVADDVAQLCQSPAALQAANVTLLAPDLLLAIRTSELRLFTEVAAAVQFAPKLLRIATKIVGRLRQSSPVFNGLHLRFNPSKMSGAHVAATLTRYYDNLAPAFQQGSTAPLYVASGFFAEHRDVSPSLYQMLETWFRNWVVGRGHASRVVNRHIMLANDTSPSADEHLMLHSEQCTAVDLLVLMAADRVVGSRSSPFTFFLHELRALKRIPRSSVVIVDGPWWLLPLTAAVYVKA